MGVVVPEAVVEAPGPCAAILGVVNVEWVGAVCLAGAEVTLTGAAVVDEQVVVVGAGDVAGARGKTTGGFSAAHLHVVDGRVGVAGDNSSLCV